MQTALKTIIGCALGAFLTIGVPISATAQGSPAPTLIPFQGRLTDQEGTPYTTGQYNIIFNLYGQAVGGTSDWTERHEKVSVINGMVNVFLGSVNAFPSDHPDSDPPAPFFSQVKYLGITIDARPGTPEPEMVPRQIIVPAFFAHKAGLASNSAKLNNADWTAILDGANPSTAKLKDEIIADDFVTTRMIENGAVTTAKLADLAVTTDQLADGAVGGDKLAPDAAISNLLASGLNAVPLGGIVFSETPSDPNLLAAGYTQVTEHSLISVGDEWTGLQNNGPPTARRQHVAVWTGANMLVWGGLDNTSGRFGDGASYTPTTGTWTPISLAGAPSARQAPVAVWTGSAMIVWGGGNTIDYQQDGAKYDPVSDTWSPITTSGAPTRRQDASGVWSGDKMIVWGGDGSGPRRGDGAAYDPAADAWTSISSVGAPAAREKHSAVWTGETMIIWGGSGTSVFGDGAKYDPQTDTWSPITSVGAPAARYDHSAVWTGNRMVVWGGQGGGYLGDGGIYDPETDTWSTLTTTDSPSARRGHTSVWAETAMIVWGGYSNATLSNGGRYMPKSEFFGFTPSCPIVYVDVLAAITFKKSMGDFALGQL